MLKAKTILFLGYFAKYIPWALVQQSLVILPFYFLVDHASNGLLLFICITNSILLFSFVFHVGNTRLTLWTLLLAVLTYPLIFNFSIYFIIPTIFIHALFRAYLKVNNVEMRVWRFN